MGLFLKFALEEEDGVKGEDVCSMTEDEDDMDDGVAGTPSTENDCRY